MGLQALRVAGPAVVRGFKAARGFGYKGPMSQLEKYKKSDPVFARKMAMYESKIKSRKEKKWQLKIY